MKIAYLITKYFALRCIGRSKVTMALKNESPVGATTEPNVQ